MRHRSLAIGIQALAILLGATRMASAATDPAKDSVDAKSTTTSNATWDKAAAAKYLDSREVWWQAWPPAQKDHETVCVSCHTNVPYALARPALRAQLGEQKLSDPERIMLDSIIKRVNLGSEAEPFYNDAKHGPGKTREARNAESVNNALILARYDAARYDAQQGHLQDVTRKALAAMWALQERIGPKSGAWLWQNFHFSPWEADESEYYGACMAAIATGIAPGHYRDDPKIQGNLALLRDYLRRQATTQPLVNRIVLLWASSKLPGLMTDQERAVLKTEIYSKQQPDGGWSLTTLGTWKRHDSSPFDTRSDGYATGLTVLALEESGRSTNSPEAKRGVDWLLANQSKTDGLWPAWSLNLQRDPASGVGRFMSDAATAISMMALEDSRQTR
jgi:squalene-hopene/tetraprenyl-beta-curcumene cyclase